MDNTGGLNIVENDFVNKNYNSCYQKFCTNNSHHDHLCTPGCNRDETLTLIAGYDHRQTSPENESIFKYISVSFNESIASKFPYFSINYQSNINNNINNKKEIHNRTDIINIMQVH